MCSERMRFFLCVACRLGLQAVSAVAIAQPAEGAETAPALAQATPDAEDTELTRARETVARGEKLFAVRNYDAALTEFLSAYRELQGHPHQYFVLHNIALCHERMFRYDLALQYYERYLSEGGQDAEDRKEVMAVVETLRGLLATLDVTSNVRAEVWVDDRHMGQAPGAVLVPAGRHVVELRAAVYEAVRREVYVSAHETQHLSFELGRLSSYKGLHPVYFWTGVGLSVAALSVGSVLGANAMAQSADARDRAKLHIDSPTDRDRVRHLTRAADVCLGAAAVLGITSAVLFFVTDWEANEARPAAQTARRLDQGLRLSALLSTRALVATLRGEL
jgi:tetratricopeptide (TPR) repeat protein